MEDSPMDSSEEALSMIMMKLLEGCFVKKQSFQQLPPHRVKQQATVDSAPPPQTPQTEELKQTQEEQPKIFGDDMYTPEPPDEDDNLAQEKEEDKNTMQLFQDEMYTPTGDDDEQLNENIETGENNDNQNTISLNKKPNSLEGIETVFHIKNIHSHRDVWSPIVLKDNRIATVASDGSISIIEVDYEKRTFIQVVSKKAEQNSLILSICELDDGRLVTASGNVNIKVWKFFQKDLILLKTLQVSTIFAPFWKVIKLTKNRFASCSIGGAIAIWNADNYKEITVLTSSASVNNIIQLNGKEILVSSCGKPAIDFWDLTTYKRIKTIKNVHAVENSHMIELQSGCIAVSAYSTNFPIVIIDPVSYTIIHEIIDKDYIKANSSLMTWTDHSFMFIKGGYFIQFSTSTYEVLYKAKLDSQLEGYGGMTVVNDKYLIVQNNWKGISILRPY
jgi:WD40 repeat protein